MDKRFGGSRVEPEGNAQEALIQLSQLQAVIRHHGARPTIAARDGYGENVAPFGQVPSALPSIVPRF
jgi:hypothetical protein